MKSRLFELVVLVASSVYVASTPGGAYGAAGELDPTFGTNGLVRIDVEHDTDGASSVFAQPDGKLLVGRSNDLESDDFSVVRLEYDGALDPSFGNGGRASLEVPDFHGRTSVVLQQSDGGVVSAGTLVRNRALGSYPFVSEPLALVRFFADGRLDTSFGSDGIVRIDFDDVTGASGGARAYSSTSATALLQQSDGKIVAAGSAAYMSPWDYGGFGYPNMVLVRFDTSGGVDSSFGEGGRIALEASNVFDNDSAFHALAQQPDGKLVAAGVVGVRAAVARFMIDGTLDASFGDSGLVILPFGQSKAASSADAVRVLPDGTIVIAGTTRFTCDLDDPACAEVVDGVLARLDSDGHLDPTFGTNGIVAFHARPDARTQVASGALVIEPSGLLVGGDSESRDGARYGFIARFTPDGALDRDFGNAGVTLIDVGRGQTPSRAITGGLSRGPTGQIVTALTAYSSRQDWTIVVARMTPAGSGPGTIGLVQTSLAADEGADAKFFVRRAGGSRGPVTVDYSTALGSSASSDDFEPATGTLTWSDGDTSDRVIAIPIVRDGIVENGEEFTVTLTNPGGGATLAAAAGRAEITDVNAGAGVLQFALATISVKEGDIRTDLLVTRSGGQNGAVSVEYASYGITADEVSDYSPLSGTLRWQHGDSGPKTIRLNITAGGPDEEPDEIFRVELRNPSGGATLGILSSADVTIMDVPPSPTFFPPPPSSVVSANGTAAASDARNGGGAGGLLEVVVLALILSILRRRGGEGSATRT